MPKRSGYNRNYRNQGSSSTQGIFLVGGVGSNGGTSSSADSSGGGIGGGGGGSSSDNVVEVTLGGDDLVRPSDGGGSDPKQRGRVDLTSEEVVTLCCGVLFFISFFVAMYAQVTLR